MAAIGGPQTDNGAGSRRRRSFPDDPVLLIMVTAYTDADKKAESLRAGVNGYISKPLSATRLAQVLAGAQTPSTGLAEPRDSVFDAELQKEINEHVAQCLQHGASNELEPLRVSAHKLTSLAMIASDQRLQSLCRDIQLAAREKNLESASALVLGQKHWKEN